MIGELEQVTDGDKEGTEGSFVELGPGVQHVTVDLGTPQEVFAVVFWHFHKTPRVYFDVVVQLADDAAFNRTCAPSSTTTTTTPRGSAPGRT